MMGDHISYHECITGEEAEKRLKHFAGHCYLTRYSKVHKSYMLSVYKKERNGDTKRHFKIIVEKEKKVRIERKEKSFDNIQELLNYYEKARIDEALIHIGKKFTKEEYDRKEDEWEENRRAEEANRQHPPHLEGQPPLNNQRQRRMKWRRVRQILRCICFPCEN